MKSYPIRGESVDSVLQRMRAVIDTIQAGGNESTAVTLVVIKNDDCTLSGEVRFVAYIKEVVEPTPTPGVT